MKQIADELATTIEAACDRLFTIDDAEAAKPLRAGGWSKKQVLGHLVDSAANNHQRFVRASQSSELAFPAYAQEEWVNLQGYQDASWAELIDLWRLYNRHLVRVIRRIPADKSETPCRIGASAPVSLSFLVTDYLRHLTHHLAQLGEGN